ncbi:hypothetical protein QZH41_015490 [Actinostola sp. cb2023]|nr:hypothetical protein QZH41_015490 [Actinostola sp. cb2023]
MTCAPYAGAHNHSKNEISTQTFGIDKMVIHQRFETDKWYAYDIALVKLSRPAVLNFAVGLACLPRQGDRVPVGTKCYLSDGQWVVRGIVSWGDYKCRARTTYTVFARISSFVDWIKMHTAVKPAPCVTQPDLGDECSDNHYYCSVWKEKGMCTHSYYRRSLKNYCSFSCGYCTLSVKAKCLDSFIDSILQDLSE